MSAPLPPIDTEKLLADSIAGRFPDAHGRFGPFGGRFVPETLIPALERLESGMRAHLHSRKFQERFSHELSSWVGRPTAMTHAARLSKAWGAQIWLKREDLAHTGAHKINNAVGQALLAQELGAKRIIAETGAGQHGVASAAACARLGMPCTVYMGEIDMERQAPNVGRMRLMGATVVPVTSGERTLRAAIDEALRDWVSDPTDTYYLLGSVVGPHPYPYLVRELQAVIGREARAQMLKETGVLPDALIACVGGGSNSIGIFTPFVADSDVELIGVEAAGDGLESGRHGAPLTAAGLPGVLHGAYSAVMQDEDGQILEAHSISAGLDYPGVGPEHSWLKDQGRVKYFSATDRDAMEAFMALSRLEGIIPALEPAHALAHVMRIAPEMDKEQIVVVTLSGRGDKDVFTAAAALGEKL